eukprot:9482636-Pyramimonas_sp.AAC.1
MGRPNLAGTSSRSAPATEGGGCGASHLNSNNSMRRPGGGIFGVVGLEPSSLPAGKSAGFGHSSV